MKKKYYISFDGAHIHERNQAIFNFENKNIRTSQGIWCNVPNGITSFFTSYSRPLKNPTLTFKYKIVMWKVRKFTFAIG